MRKTARHTSRAKMPTHTFQIPKKAHRAKHFHYTQTNATTHLYERHKTQTLWIGTVQMILQTP
jgi:hypothetical protein